jgi:hypothetical protein
MSDFIDALDSILRTKEYWYSDDKDYSPVGVNIGLSQNVDSILWVNEMNVWWRHLSPRMHYDFLFHSIRKMNRQFGKWAKKTKEENDEDIQAVMTYYNVNKQKALDYLRILTPDMIKEVKEHVVR